MIANAFGICVESEGSEAKEFKHFYKCNLNELIR
jgi:hypothetical protein